MSPLPTHGAPASCLSDLSDVQLLQLFATGRRDAVEELFCRSYRSAYRAAYRILGNETDAQDAVQDGFLKAFTRLAGFQGRSSPKTWLLRVVSNAARDLGRRYAAEAKKLDGYRPAVKSLSPPDAILAREQREVIIHLLREHATPQEREVFRLRWAGRTYEEIAQDFEGMTAAAVRGVWRKVLHKLRQEMDRLELSTP